MTVADPVALASASAQARRRARRPTANRWVQRLIVWGALLVLYELAAIAAGAFYLPRVEQIVSAFFRLVGDGDLKTVAVSLEELVVGLGLAAAVGVPVGLAMGRSRVIDAAVGMWVRLLFVTSLSAVLPLLIILFDVGFTFRVAVVFLFCVFFILVNAAAGARAVPERLVRTAEAFDFSPLQRFRLVVLPASLPHVVVGLRLAVAQAFSGMILAELWISRGTGALLLGFGRNRDLPPFFAMVLLITLLAALSAAGLKWLERRLMPWAEGMRSGS